MGGLFSKPKYPDPEPPATMPDPEDPMSRRNRRKAGGMSTTSSTASDKLSTVPGTIGREFQRSTLGAN